MTWTGLVLPRADWSTGPATDLPELLEDLDITEEVRERMQAR
jgi:hypothetical protein